MGAFASLPGKIAVVIVMIVAAWIGGFVSGRMSGKAQQLADTVEAFQKRGKIDAAVDGKPDYDICIAVGGVPEQCNQLRRVDTATQGK